MGSIRGTLDAAYDITGDFQNQITNGDSIIGFTSRIVQYYVDTYNVSISAAYTYYSIFLDPSDNQPYDDAVIITNNNQAVYDPVGTFANVDRGLRHYYNQMQAMEGYSVGIIGGIGQGSNIDPVSSEIDTNYKSTNISMGEMRNFGYPRGTNTIWPSTSAPDGLENTGNGAISVGDAA